MRRDGERLILITSLRAYSTRSLKNTLKRMGWYSRSKQGEAEGVRVYHPYPRRFDRMVKEGGLRRRKGNASCG